VKINIADWNGFDWLLAAILALSTVRALMRGLVRAIFGLIGVLGGLQVATWNYIAVGDWMVHRQMIESQPTARIVAFLAIAAAVVVAFELVGRGVKKTAHAVGLGAIDRLLGGVFGFARGVLIGAVAVVGVKALAPRSAWIEGSKLSAYFLAAPHAVSFVVPHDLR